MGMKLLELTTFTEWLEVDSRLLRIQDHGYFGDAKLLGDGVAELKWTSGMRIYFARVELNEDESVLLILGGNKNGQNRDITKAKALLRKYAEGEVESWERTPRVRPV